MGKLAFTSGGTSIQTWPETIRRGESLHVAFLVPVRIGSAAPGEFEVTLHDHRRRAVATIARGPLHPVGGVVCVEWNGRDDRGAELPAGRYRLRVTRPRSTFLLECTLHIEP